MIYSKALRTSNSLLRLMYPAKLSFIIEGEIKTSHDKQKQKEFMTTNITEDT
jgi:hypothetical protein